MNWQPIETAPKDGTYILIWFRDAFEHQLVFWSKYSDRWETLDGFSAFIHTPTHWMPLPEPPEIAK